MAERGFHRHNRFLTHPRYLYAGSALLSSTAVLAWVAVGTGWGQSRDQAAMVGVAGFSRSGSAAAHTFAALTVPLIAAVIVLTIVVALTRPDRIAVLVKVSTVFTVPLITAMLTKHTLPRPILDDLAIGDNSFPSGTLTAVTAAVLALIIATPAEMRILSAAPGLLAILATAYTVVALRWHRPSDVIGALLLAVGIALIVLAFGHREHATVKVAGTRNERPVPELPKASIREGQHQWRRYC